MRPRALIPHVATSIVSVTLSAAVAFAWTGPTSSPPNSNADAPINVGTTAQFKNGNIGLWGNLLLAASGGSYLNLGIVTLLDGATTTSITLDSATPGTHTILYIVTDPAGLSGTATRTVVVSATAQVAANDNPPSLDIAGTSTSH